MIICIILLETIYNIVSRRRLYTLVSTHLIFFFYNYYTWICLRPGWPGWRMHQQFQLDWVMVFFNKDIKIYKIEDD